MLRTDKICQYLKYTKIFLTILKYKFLHYEIKNVLIYHN